MLQVREGNPMARELSPQRRKVVVLAACIASISGLGPVLFQHHRYLGLVWIALLAVALTYLMVQFVKLRRSGDVCR
jgi:hypothetical protein